MVRKTAKARKKAKESAKFKKMRCVLRDDAVAARKAYVLAAQATPQTPGDAVESMVAADTWESITALCDVLKSKDWFTSPPKNSMLMHEPACAWLLAGVSAVSLRCKQLPALNKHVLRGAVQHWISHHYVLPVGGTGKDGEHYNIMELFVTFVWAWYTINQKPKVPAMTDLGRFLFTYIWRRQHPLMG
jgi:hypothetical protein